MSELQGDLGDLQVRFWTQLLIQAREKGVLYHVTCKPVRESFLSVTAGRSWLSFEYLIYHKEKAGVQLYTSHENPAVNDRRCAWMKEKRSEIEQNLG